MEDADIKTLADQIVRGLSGPLISLVEQYRAKALLSEIRPQPTGMNRPITRREFETWRRGFTLPNGDDPEVNFL